MLIEYYLTIEKNGDLSPDEVTSGSGKKVWS